MSQIPTHNVNDVLEPEGDEEHEEDPETLEQSEEYEDVYSSESDPLARPDRSLTPPPAHAPIPHAPFTVVRIIMIICSEIQQIMSF